MKDDVGKILVIFGLLVIVGGFLYKAVNPGSWLFQLINQLKQDFGEYVPFEPPPCCTDEIIALAISQGVTQYCMVCE